MFKNSSNITGFFCILIVIFCVLGCRHCDGGYNVSGGKVYYNNGKPGMFPIGSDRVMEYADAETFEIINRNYAKDKNNIYYQSWSVSKADRATFKVMKGPFARDKNHIFFGNSILTDKTQSFKILFTKGSSKNTHFSTDGEKIFKNDEPFYPDIVDVPTFEGVGRSRFMRDKNYVYNALGRLEGADPNTFEVISYFRYGSNYARDKSNVYYDGTIIEGADVKTHEIIDRIYHKDKNHVYKYRRKVSDDPENFQVPKQ